MYKIKTNLSIFLLLFSIGLLKGETVSATSPKILLRNVPFEISFHGVFSDQNKYTLLIDEKHFLPYSINKNKIVFKNIKIAKPGNKKLALYKELLSVFEFQKTVIPGWISIVPTFIAIALAFISKSVIPSLFAAVWIGAWSLNGFKLEGVISSLLDSFHFYILNAMIERDHAIITLFTLMLGGMVGIVYRNGGMHGIIHYLIKKADTPKKGQLAVWLMGLLIFFDDYSNTLIVGNTSRLLCDKLKISRQKLAYLVDSTSAPVATIAIMTTWVGFQIGIISDSLPGLEGINESAYMLYLHSIPYSFYPFLAIAMVGIVIISGKDFGPMVNAEKSARLAKKHNSTNLEESSTSDNGDLFMKKNIPTNARNAIIPILVLIVSMFYFIITSGNGKTIIEILSTSDIFGALMHSTLLSVVVAAILSISQKVLSINETLDAWFSGVKFMLPGIIVLVLAWALADISKDLNTANYIVSALGDTIPMSFLPCIVFLIAAATAFGTGSSWGVMAILMPLVIPLTWTIMINNSANTPENYHILYSSIACVLTGAVWADHCSPISDTTILTSMATGCELMDHVWTQMPYALSTGAAALFLGTLPASFGAPWWILLFLGVFSQVLVLYYFGHKADKK
tara:strand:+ start:1022 stop:2896 length:1875 start_codon:yes stop_codon:yes gene_type:complete